MNQFRLFLLSVIVLLMITSQGFSQQGNVFNKAELDWIERHRNNITVATECFFPPMIFKDSSGRPSGLSIDYLREIENVSGLNFNYMACDDLHVLLFNSDPYGYELITSLKPTPSRKLYLDFTDAYIEVPVVIVSRKHYLSKLSFDRLDDYRIAVGEGYSPHDFLLQNYPHYDIYPVGNEQEGIDKLVQKEVDLLIIDLATLSYMTRVHDVKGLKVVGMFPLNYNLAFACPQQAEMDTLISVVNKSLMTISMETRNQIYKKWIHIDLNSLWFNTRVLQWIIWGLVGLVLIVLYFVFWNSMLRKRVKLRTADLDTELQLRLQKEKELKYQNREFVKLNLKLQEINSALQEAFEKASESDRLKSAFLANISHEVRTPMNGIMGFSALLANENVSEELRLYVQRIQQNCDRLLIIVDDILEISLLQSENFELTPSVFNLNDLMDEIGIIYRDKFSDSKIEFKVSKTLSEAESLIQTDRDRLQRILQHLIDNAFKFTQRGVIELGYNYKDEQLEFYVKDTGIGIAEEMQEKIFELFRQVELETSRLYGGMGVGLSISKKLIELLGGTIWLESEPQDAISGKQGSTSFYFTIPYVPVSQQDEAGKLIQEVLFEGRAYTILIVEDEISNFEYLREVLSKYNLNILHAENGVEAVKMCKNHPEITLVLMDIKMPLMDGYEATRQIKLFNPKLPVIAQTAYAQKEDRGKAYDSGCSDFLSKPIHHDELVDVINRYLS